MQIEFLKIMKKITFSLIAAVIFCNNNAAFSGSMGTVSPEPNWTGIYLGANSGYWKSQANNVVTTGSPRFINQTFDLGANNIVNALTQMATNTFSLKADGFIGGGQIGYNYQYNRRFLMGLDINLDGLSNANNTFALQKVVSLADFNEEYVGSLAVKQRINYLGTVRARVGYLYRPTFLVYGTGGFAYGNVTLDTAWTANESLEPTVYPPVFAQNSLSKTCTGWTIGGGVEWLFKPNWSTKIEYVYYDLSTINAHALLSQVNMAETSPALWGSVMANTALPISVGTIKIGISYHFS